MLHSSMFLIYTFNLINNLTYTNLVTFTSVCLGFIYFKVIHLMSKS